MGLNIESDKGGPTPYLEEVSTREELSSMFSLNTNEKEFKDLIDKGVGDCISAVDVDWKNLPAVKFSGDGIGTLKVDLSSVYSNEIDVNSPFSKGQVLGGLLVNLKAMDVVSEKMDEYGATDNQRTELQLMRGVMSSTMDEISQGRLVSEYYIEQPDGRIGVGFWTTRKVLTAEFSALAIATIACNSSVGEVLPPTDTGANTGPTPIAAEVMPSTPTSFVEQGPEATQEPSQEAVSYRAEDLTVEMVKDVMGTGGEYPAGFYIENENGERVLSSNVQVVFDKVQLMMDASGIKGVIRTNGEDGDSFRWAIPGANGEWLMIKNENNEWILADRPDLQPGLDIQNDEYKYGFPEKLSTENTFQSIQLGSEDWFYIEVDVSGNPVRVWNRESESMTFLVGAEVEEKIEPNYGYIAPGVWGEESLPLVKEWWEGYKEKMPTNEDVKWMTYKDGSKVELGEIPGGRYASTRTFGLIMTEMFDFPDSIDPDNYEQMILTLAPTNSDKIEEAGNIVPIRLTTNPDKSHWTMSLMIVGEGGAIRNELYWNYVDVAYNMPHKDLIRFLQAGLSGDNPPLHGCQLAVSLAGAGSDLGAGTKHIRSIYDEEGDGEWEVDNELDWLALNPQGGGVLVISESCMTNKMWEVFGTLPNNPVGDK